MTNRRSPQLVVRLVAASRVIGRQLWWHRDTGRDAYPTNTLHNQWASYQIGKIAGCACAGNAGNFSPRRRFQRKPLVSDPGMHHGTCVTHVPWCMSGSLTCGHGENVPGIPGTCAPAILRIWQEVHGGNSLKLIFGHMFINSWYTDIFVLNIQYHWMGIACSLLHKKMRRACICAHPTPGCVSYHNDQI